MPKPPIKPGFKKPPPIKLPSNEKGFAYSGKLPEQSPQDILKSITDKDIAINKFVRHINSNNASNSTTGQWVFDQLKLLMNQKLSLYKTLDSYLLPPTERKKYSPEMDRLIDSHQRLVDQLEQAKKADLPELVDRLSKHSRKLSTKIQNLGSRYQPLGTPELGEIPERPIPAVPEPTGDTGPVGSRRSTVTRLRRGLEEETQIKRNLQEQWEQFKNSRSQ